MNTTKQLKLATIICHAFIIVSFGHGIMTLGLLEIFYIPVFSKAHFGILLTTPFESRLLMVVLTSFIGQAFLAYSIVANQQGLKMMLHIGGLIMLWVSILYFTYGISHDHYTHFSFLSALPFAVCTFITFAGNAIRKLYYKVIDI